MAALPLLVWLLRFATPEELAVIKKVEADDGLVPGTAFLGGPSAEWALTAALERGLATRPAASALDIGAAQRVPFALEVLRGRVHEVDWPAGRWDRFEAIEVEVGRQKSAGQVEMRATARAFAARYPDGNQREWHQLYHDQHPDPAVKIPLKLFPARARGRPRK